LHVKQKKNSISQVLFSFRSTARKKNIENAHFFQKASTRRMKRFFLLAISNKSRIQASLIFKVFVKSRRRYEYFESLISIFI
jgi:hypothetical protein